MTEELRAALTEALPDRPFTLRLWDGTTLPPTNGDAGPTFHLTTPVALGHILRAPSQLGVGRAYVSGGIDVDDMDTAIALISQWSPPPMDNATKLKIARGAVKAGALRRVPKVPAMEFRPEGRAALDPPRQALGHPPLQPLERVLLAVPRRVDDVLVRDLVPRGADAGGGAVHQARARVHEARPPAGHARAGRRLRLGRVRDPRRARARRARHRNHAERAAGAAGARTGGGRGPGRPGRHPRHGLPRDHGRDVRRDRARSAWSSTSAR